MKRKALNFSEMPWSLVSPYKITNKELKNMSDTFKRNYLDERMEDEEKRTPRFGASGRFLTFKLSVISIRTN